MKNKIFFLLFFLLIFVSCVREEPISPIVGDWDGYTTVYRTYTVIGDPYVYHGNVDLYISVTYYENGTYNEYGEYSVPDIYGNSIFIESYTMAGNYSFDGRTFTQYFPDGGVESYFVSFSPNEMYMDMSNNNGTISYTRR